MNLRKAWFVFFVVPFLVSLGCSEPDSSTPSQSNGSRGSATTPQSSVNNWTTTPPKVICGPDGYKFLESQYIGPNCASCHTTGTFTMERFTDINIATATAAAIKIGQTQFLAKCVANNFCGPYCNLDPNGEVYAGITQWFNFPNQCP